jgi:hypothetical protein
MHARSRRPSALLEKRTKKPVLRILVAYEDPESGYRAKEILERLNLMVGHDLDIRSTMWKFNVLLFPPLNSMAVGDAAEADIIIIATGPKGELPRGVQEWINHWLSNKQRRPSAMASLIADEILEEDAQAVEPPAVSAYLREVCRKGNLDFISLRSQGENDIFEGAIETAPGKESGRMAAPGHPSSSLCWDLPEIVPAMMKAADCNQCWLGRQPDQSFQWINQFNGSVGRRTVGWEITRNS